MFTLFFNGLFFGVWLLGAVIPILLVLSVLGVAAYRLTREEYIDAHTFMEDFPPELPTSEEEPEAKEKEEPEPEPKKPHRFIASTIVRPPEISERTDDDNTDDDDTEES